MTSGHAAALPPLSTDRGSAALEDALARIRTAVDALAGPRRDGDRLIGGDRLTLIREGSATSSGLTYASSRHRNPFSAPMTILKVAENGVSGTLLRNLVHIGATSLPSGLGSHREWTGIQHASDMAIDTLRLSEAALRACLDAEERAAAQINERRAQDIGLSACAAALEANPDAYEAQIEAPGVYGEGRLLLRIRGGAPTHRRQVAGPEELAPLFSGIAHPGYLTTLEGSSGDHAYPTVLHGPADMLLRSDAKPMDLLLSIRRSGFRGMRMHPPLELVDHPSDVDG